MKNIFLFLGVLLLFSCQSANDPFEYGSEEEWKLAFRVFESEMYENYELGSQQLDSLIVLSSRIQPVILNSGLKCLANLNQHEKLLISWKKAPQRVKAGYVRKNGFSNCQFTKEKRLFVETYAYPKRNTRILNLGSSF